MSEQKFPPRLIISIHVDGDFNPYLRINEERELNEYFGDPMHVEAKPPITYVHESLLAAARAEAFEEAALDISDYEGCEEAAAHLQIIAGVERKKAQRGDK